MVNKIIFNSYDSDNGETYVIIKNKYGIFDGTSRKSPEDMFSSFAGFDCAESKAIMQCYREQKQKAAAKYKALQDCYNALTSVKDIDFKSVEMSRFRKQLHIAKKEIAMWKDRIEAEKKRFWAMIEGRENMAKKIQATKDELAARRAEKRSKKTNE